MIKKASILVFLMSSAYFLQAQSIWDKWKELKEFHTVMSQTFHPSEEGNLEPIKKRSSEMAEKANILVKSTIPQEYNTPKIRMAVKKLQKGSKELDAFIKNSKASDETIKQKLSALHDVFHEIVGLCKNENH